MSKDDIINCEEALARLFEYIDHELNADHNHDMDEHMSRCRSCYSRLEFEKRLRDHVQEAVSEQVPEGLQNRLKALIKKL